MGVEAGKQTFHYPLIILEKFYRIKFRLLVPSTVHIKRTSIK